jgi:hypothetical protein
MNVSSLPVEGQRAHIHARHQRAGPDPFVIVVKMITIEGQRAHIHDPRRARRLGADRGCFVIVVKMISIESDRGNNDH